MLIATVKDDFNLALKTNNITRKQVATMLGVSSPRISQITNKNAITDSLIGLFDALGFDVIVSVREKKITKELLFWEQTYRDQMQRKKRISSLGHLRPEDVGYDEELFNVAERKLRELSEKSGAVIERGETMC